jgi:peptide/nickel transport system substrate-binding protein
MRYLRWQILIAVLGMLLIGSMLSGKAEVVEVTSEPVAGGVYTEALVGDPRRFNPLLDFANPVDRDVGRLLFSGLTRFDAAGRPVPDLANWAISEDELTYTFVLRADALWHDGRRVTTGDVAYTVGLLQDPHYPGPPDVGLLWKQVRLEVINEHAFSLTLPEPFAPFLDYTSFGLLPAHLLRDVTATNLPKAAFNSAPVGSGPFSFVGLTGEDGQVTGVVLTAFERYYGPRPLLHDVQFKYYPDTASALAAYRAGEVLGLGRIDDGSLASVLAEPELSVYTALRPEYSLIFLNLQSDDLPFFQDKRVRQALLRGLNRQAMVANIMGGQAVVANSPVLPGSWAHNPNLPDVRYDPDAAARLLDLAGWIIPDGASPGSPGYVRQRQGVELRFTLTVPDTPEHTALGRSAVETWSRLGVAASLATAPPASLRDSYLNPRPRTFDALLVDLSFSGTPDPDPYPLWHETQVESGQNYGGFADRTTSQLLEQARITTDLEARARHYYAFQSRFADQTPALLLFYPVYTYAVDASVRGVQVGHLIEPSDRLAGLPQWTVVTRRVIVEQAGH